MMHYNKQKQIDQMYLQWFEYALLPPRLILKFDPTYNVAKR